MTYPESVLCGLEWLRTTQPVTCCTGCDRRRNCEEFGCYIIREAISVIEALLMQRGDRRDE